MWAVFKGGLSEVTRTSRCMASRCSARDLSALSLGITLTATCLALDTCCALYTCGEVRGEAWHRLNVALHGIPMAL